MGNYSKFQIPSKNEGEWVISGAGTFTQPFKIFRFYLGCVEEVQPVTFDIQQYLGENYEIYN